MKNKLSGNNKGFSLIELIVAVLIMGILAGGAAVAFKTVFDRQTDAGIKKIEDALKLTRTNALGLKNDEDTDGYTSIYARFYKSGKTLYVDVCQKNQATGSVDTLHTEKIGSDSLQVVFKYITGTETYENVSTTMATVGTDEVLLFFKKETGGIAKFATVGISGNLTPIPCNTIGLENVSDQSNHDTLIVVSLTGRCFVDE